MGEALGLYGASADDGSRAWTDGPRAVLREDDSRAVLTSAADWVDTIGRTSFADAGLAALQTALQAASWSVYELRPGEPPLLHLSASRGVADRTRDCFAAYASGLWRRDTSFDAVRRQAMPAVTTMHADEAPSADHRDAIYRAHQVLERFSVAAPTASHTLLAVNLYRHEHQGRFSPRERERFENLAPIIFRGVQRHLALRGEARVASPRSSADVRAALLATCSRLTTRELDVCERLLRGWSHDGIAADLQLKVSSVRTYRARAYTRLGVHFRSELFARFGMVAATTAFDD